MLDPVLSLSTELAGFCMVTLFTTLCHFTCDDDDEDMHPLSPVYFSSSHSLLAFSRFVLVFLYYCSLQISKPSLSLFHLFSSKYDRTTAYYVLQPSCLKTSLCSHVCQLLSVSFIYKLHTTHHLNHRPFCSSQNCHLFLSQAPCFVFIQHSCSYTTFVYLPFHLY